MSGEILAKRSFDPQSLGLESVYLAYGPDVGEGSELHELVAVLPVHLQVQKHARTLL